MFSAVQSCKAEWTPSPFFPGLYNVFPFSTLKTATIQPLSPWVKPWTMPTLYMNLSLELRSSISPRVTSSIFPYPFFSRLYPFSCIQTHIFVFFTKFSHFYLSATLVPCAITTGLVIISATAFSDMWTTQEWGKEIQLLLPFVCTCTVLHVTLGTASLQPCFAFAPFSEMARVVFLMLQNLPRNLTDGGFYKCFQSIQDKFCISARCPPPHLVHWSLWCQGQPSAEQCRGHAAVLLSFWGGCTLDLVCFLASLFCLFGSSFIAFICSVTWRVCGQGILYQGLHIGLLFVLGEHHLCF